MPLTKTLTDGRTAVITRHLPADSETAAPDWDVTIDGQPFTSGRLHKRPVNGKVIDAIGSKRVIGLTPEESALLDGELQVEREAARAARLQTPAGQRHELVVAHERALDDWQAARDSAMEDYGDAGQRIGAAQAALDAAEGALIAFDAAHPDLTAAREAKRAARIDEAVRRAFSD